MVRQNRKKNSSEQLPLFTDTLSKSIQLTHGEEHTDSLYEQEKKQEVNHPANGFIHSSTIVTNWGGAGDPRDRFFIGGDGEVKVYFGKWKMSVYVCETVSPTLEGLMELVKHRLEKTG